MNRREDFSSRANASAFKDWVFYKTNPGCKQKKSTLPISRLQWGKANHRIIEELRLWCRRGTRNLSPSHRWDVLHIDAHNDEHTGVFYASRLRLRGEPMSCNPDIVFWDSLNRVIVVVERKMTSKIPPKTGYPNVWAQLWCYSWIDDWEGYRPVDVLLVSQFWIRDRSRPLFKQLVLCNVKPVDLRSRVDFHVRYKSLFEEYGGQFVE